MRSPLLVLAAMAALPAGAAGAAPPEPVPCVAISAPCWDPEPTTEPWQWQLQGGVDLSVEAPVYDVDIDQRGRVVDAIHEQGDRAICYLSVGTYEPFRTDAKDFPRSLLGKRLERFDNERWLDVRRLSKLGPIVEARLDECTRKGFDAVEPDNVDGYQNSTGFAIKGSDQIAFNAYVANEAHERGMAVGLKNDLGQVKRLLPYFDFAVNEQCYQYRECDVLERFVAAGKPVFGAEYRVPRRKFCERSLASGFSTIYKRFSLKAFRRTC